MRVAALWLACSLLLWGSVAAADEADAPAFRSRQSRIGVEFDAWREDVAAGPLYALVPKPLAGYAFGVSAQFLPKKHLVLSAEATWGVGEVDISLLFPSEKVNTIVGNPMVGAY